ncbi:MAG TPA: hypothetical protein VIO60_05645 [Rectinemataceae bacterium]
MNKSMKMAALALAAASILGSAIMSSCDNSFGVLADIQTETAQIGTDLFKNGIVKALGEDGSNYYAVMAKIYYRSFAGESWAVLPVNGSADYIAAGFASDQASGKIFAAILDASSSALLGVYGSANAGSSWTEIDSSAISGKTINALFWAGDSLFALGNDEAAKTYSLFHSDGSSAFTACAGLSGLANPVIGAVKAGSSYWVATSAKLFAGAAPGTFVEDATASTPSGGDEIRGLAVDSSGAVLVSNSKGFVFTLASGTWTSAEVLDGIKLGPLVEVPTAPPATASLRLIIGKNNSTYGYCEWEAATSTQTAATDDAAIFSPNSSSYTTTVYNKPLLSIHYSSANSTILVGLAAQGSSSYALYSNRYSGGAWAGWTAE